MIIELSDSDLKEIFALFSSCTKEEIAAIYASADELFFENENLDETYELTQEKAEFARDAWRSITLFLDRHGYVLSRRGEFVDLKSSSGVR